MIHAGLPFPWAIITWLILCLIAAWALLWPQAENTELQPLLTPRLKRGAWLSSALRAQWPLLLGKACMVGLFLLVIACGLYGTPIAQYNLATQLTWNIWWAGLIISILLIGSGWCAVCPWQTIASVLTRFNLFGASMRLNLPVPPILRGVWPALLLLLALTVLELGYGITASPYATATLAILIVLLSTTSHAIFERKAFCRYFCPVGRTIGFYAQLSPVALRQIDAQICRDCSTLDCYHGNTKGEPCPTGLLMKKLKENTYCTSCGNCVQSCPSNNIAVQLRPISQEACQDARPRTDETWFVLILLALALLHGITMTPFWQHQMQQLASWLGDSDLMLWAFSIGLTLAIATTTTLFAAAIAATHILLHKQLPFHRLFNDMAFMMLPLAFCYHIAHNLGHVLRENQTLSWLIHPFSAPTSTMVHASPMSSPVLLFILQSAFLVFGFYLAMLIIRHRHARLSNISPHRGQLSPLIVCAMIISSLQLWLLMQPMMMRF